MWGFKWELAGRGKEASHLWVSGPRRAPWKLFCAVPRPAGKDASGYLQSPGDAEDLAAAECSQENPNPPHCSNMNGGAVSSFHKERAGKETHRGGERKGAPERSVNVPLLISSEEFPTVPFSSRGKGSGSLLRNWPLPAAWPSACVGGDPRFLCRVWLDAPGPSGRAGSLARRYQFHWFLWNESGQGH